MPLSRKQWNNVIIIACLLTISGLTLLEQHSKRLPDSAIPLFGTTHPLQQMQLGSLWLNAGPAGWQCSATILNCQTWSNAWSSLQISPLTTTPQPSEASQQITLYTGEPSVPQQQIWHWYTQTGLLRSQSGNWYRIPPGLKAELSPVLQAGSIYQ
ncbi:hypothetical protein NFHSH190041_02360 [Shewanella sp. NFH-SH190041]|uniref:hypothetical protein n=1 Tax=Shewanella sp. NFH-SH190041 TaxID=2950245 RepID=UPI0021C25BD5|nr:hypothetical protein [Shewanella sp. NFH-SH190041]BDM62784.1 hypothetical protein NFHSH190041_02360 [Shewanella sp. NFH-SH190041]